MTSYKGKYCLQIYSASFRSELLFFLRIFNLLKEKIYANEITSLCFTPNQLLNQLVDFYKIQYGCHAIEGDLDYLVLMP
jgi:hypothetical protein